MIHFFAQLAADNPALYQFGPLGIFCAFFMWRDVKRSDAWEKDRAELIAEIRGMNHRLDGMQKAQLMDICSRENAGSYLFRMAKDALARVEAREAKNKD